MAIQIRYCVTWGPDSRHLHDASVFETLRSAKDAYDSCGARAKRLVRIEYPHRMSQGERMRILKEQIA